MKTKLLFFIALVLCYSCEKQYLSFVELDQSELQLMVNEESTLEIANYYPDKPEDILVEWMSSDSNTVVVENGVVLGIKPGKAYVYAIVNGVESSSCEVSVIGVYDVNNDIYILGNHGNTLMYWKNGVPTEIKKSERTITGKAIRVHNDNIYIAAEEISEGGYRVAKYWVNGDEITLSDQKSIVNDMLIAEGDVYLVGYEVNESGVSVATLWKNGVATYLNEGKRFSMANAIAISNGDIYIVGYKYVYENQETKSFAICWKNGKETVITNNTFAAAQDICISDSRVFMLVNEFEEGVGVVKYYEDGAAFTVSDSNKPSSAYSMTVSDNVINVSGYTYDKVLGNDYATQWINGVETQLSEYDLYGGVCQLASSNGDIYVLANENQEDVSSPVYWKNGIRTYFVHPLEVSYANDIFLVAKPK